jgi:CheY-like chemotaxis protein
MNGYEVSRRLRQNPTFQDTIIVAITGYGREEDRMQSKAAGINEHFVKPISAIALRKWFAAINHNCSAN